MIRAFLAALLLAGADPARADTIKVATWNLNWLTARPAGDPALPADVVGRAPADWDRLAGYASRLGADVAALEEVDGPDAARRLFPPPRYTVVTTDDHVVQRVALAVRAPVSVVAHTDLAALDVAPADAPRRLRHGLDATLAVGATRLRVLALHLKSGCWTAAEDRQHRAACALLAQQIPLVAAWIAARRAEGVPFLVLGDFNRAFASGDPRFAALAEAAGGALRDTEAGLGSPCWGGDHNDFIDHVLLGGAAAAWLVPASLRVMVYRETDPALKERISDHCPVSVRLSLP